MIIVIEGPDNAGKTTLAMALAKKLKGLYLKTEKVPAQDEDLLRYRSILSVAKEYSKFIISDRIAAISEPIYGTICRGGHSLTSENANALLEAVDVIIYCRPPVEAIMETLSTRPQMPGVVENTRSIIAAYDAVLMNWVPRRNAPQPCLRFDYSEHQIEPLVQSLYTVQRGM